MKVALVVSAMILARVVLPTPGGPQKIMEPRVVALDLDTQGLAGAEQVFLADKFVEGAGTHAFGQRRRSPRRAFGGGARLVGLAVEEAHLRLFLEWGAPLTGGFVEQHAGGDGGIQALDGAGAGNRDGAVGMSGDFGGHAVALVADEQRDRSGEVDSVGGGSGAKRGGENLHSGFAQTRKAFVRSRGNKRNTEDAAGRGAHGFLVPGAYGAGQAHGAVCAKGLGGTEDSAEVPRVLDSGEHNDKRRQLRRPKQVHPRPLRRINECGHGLRSFRDKRGSKDAFRHDQRFGVRGQGQLGQPVLESLPCKNAADTQARVDSFFDQVRPLDSDDTAVAFGTPQRPPQFLQPRILLTLYNAKRHLEMDRHA